MTSWLKLACRLIWAVLIPQAIPSIGEQTVLIRTCLVRPLITELVVVGMQLCLCLMASLTVNDELLLSAVRRRLGPRILILAGVLTLVMAIPLGLDVCRHTAIGLLTLASMMTFPMPSISLAMLLATLGMASNLRRILLTWTSAIVVLGTDDSRAWCKSPFRAHLNLGLSGLRMNWEWALEMNLLARMG